MKELLEVLIPRFFPKMKSGEHFLCVKHEGKSDLDTSIPQKLKAWNVPNDRFIILRDTDGANCIDLKKRYIKICKDCRREDTLIRLVCQELESWYIGDLAALSAAFTDPKLNSPVNRKRFINPDEWVKPSSELTRLIKSFQKVSGARLMAETLNMQGNRSTSFNFFISGLTRVATEMGY
ncbi:DUF4276 family protein [Aquitalea pelogenes]|uniref:DUF4276 family protein n=1 Tax=Aquitalea pelogenes TaxID=1293573 RepID=UPI0035B09BC4